MNKLLRCIQLLSISAIFVTRILALQQAIPSGLEAKFSHLLQQLDTTQQLNDPLRQEVELLVQELTKVGDLNKIQRIQKRLNELAPATTKSLPKIEYLPEEGEFEEKKQVSEKLSSPIVKTPTSLVQSLKNAITVLKTQGKSSAQKIRDFITKPATVGAFPMAFVSTILDYVIFRLAYNELWPDQMPFSAHEKFAIQMAPFAVLFHFEWANIGFSHAIRTGDTKKIQYMLDTKILSPNIIKHFTQDQIFKTPITLAAQHGQSAIVQLLLEQGANISQENEQNKRIEDYLQALPAGKRKDMLKIILRHKLQHASQIHDQLISQYSPVEIIAEEALKTLLNKDIMSIVNNYLTPDYVRKKIIKVT